MDSIGESDSDDIADGHHYEALYEVIGPRLPSSSAVPDVDSYDDSFDSDDAFEEDTVRGVVKFLSYQNLAQPNLT